MGLFTRSSAYQRVQQIFEVCKQTSLLFFLTATLFSIFSFQNTDSCMHCFDTANIALADTPNDLPILIESRNQRSSNLHTIYIVADTPFSLEGNKRIKSINLKSPKSNLRYQKEGELPLQKAVVPSDELSFEISIK